MKESLSKKEEWYRRATWTEVDREHFFGKLSRSKTAFHKAQYLRIQAFHLLEAGYPAVALELMQMMFEKYPKDADLCQGHVICARAYEAIGEPTMAVEEFRKSLFEQRQHPNSRNLCWIGFGWFVVRFSLTHLYDEVWEVFREFEEIDSVRFPIHEFKFCATKAIICEKRGEKEEAKAWAVQALKNAAVKSTGIRYHQEICLVGESDFLFRRELEALATGKVVPETQNDKPSLQARMAKWFPKRR